MMAARFILCGSWCAVEPVTGARTLAAGRGAVQLAGGVNAVLPVVTLGAAAGLGRGVDLGARYELHGGIAHVFTATGRVRLGERWALMNEVSHGFFTVEEISGIQAARSPFGNGLGTAHGLAFSRWNRDGLHVSLSAGLVLRWLRPLEAEGGVELTPEVTLHAARVDVTAEWPARSGGSWWVSLRALVPVQAELRVFGYLPMVTVGRSWALP